MFWLLPPVRASLVVDGRLEFAYKRDMRQRRFLPLHVSMWASLGCGGTDEAKLGDPAGPPPACDVASDRFVPADARSLGNDGFFALGKGRTGLNGAGTSRTTTDIRYVSAANGNDVNDGSEAQPWASLQHAADTVSAGTTVLVDDSGPYSGGLELHRSGAQGAYVIFKNRDADAMPLITGDPASDAVVDIDASYIVFQGFVIADHDRGTLDGDAIGIQIEPRNGDISHIEIRNNIVHDIGPGQIEDGSCYYNGHGIIAQSEGALISDLVIDGNELHDLYVGNSEVLVVNGDVSDFCVTRNFVHDVDNIAIDIIGYEKNSRETARRGGIADNVILDASNYWPYCTRGNCTYPRGDESSDGIYVDGGASLMIEYNVVGRTDHGIELQSENGQLIRDVEVQHNVVFNSNYRNFTLGPSYNSTEHDNEFFDDPALADPQLEGCK